LGYWTKVANEDEESCDTDPLDAEPLITKRQWHERRAFVYIHTPLLSLTSPFGAQEAR